MAHTNVLFLTVLVMIFVGLYFSIYQMATAYSNKIVDSTDIQIEAANIKVRTGYVSIAITMIAIIALSFYLTFAYEVKELISPVEVEVFDIGHLVAACSEYAKPSSN